MAAVIKCLWGVMSVETCCHGGVQPWPCSHNARYCVLQDPELISGQSYASLSRMKFLSIQKIIVSYFEPCATGEYFCVSILTNVALGDVAIFTLQCSSDIRQVIVEVDELLCGESHPILSGVEDSRRFVWKADP